MIAKLTAKNQLTLPRQAVEALGEVPHFDVEVEDGRLVRIPVRLDGAAAVRRKFAQLNLTDADNAEAVTWTR